MPKYLFCTLLSVAFGFGFVFGSPVRASDLADKNQTDHAQIKSSGGIPSNINSADKWFFYFGLGIVPQPKFDTGIQSGIDSGKQNNQWSGEYGGVLELPGIYYRVGKSTVVGIIGNFIFENYTADRRNNESLGYDTYNLSASAMTSTGDQPGLGYFARLDFGPTDLVEIDQDPAGYHRHFFSGLFEQLALGYGFQSSLRTRMLLHLNTFYEDVAEHYQMGISFNIGFFL